MPSRRNVRGLARAMPLVALAALGCQQQAPTAVAPTAPAAKEVAVVQARREAWPRTIRVQGSLLAYEDAVIGSKLPGRVAAVTVDLGSIVRRGEVLVKLVRDELDLRLELAEAQLQQACATIGIAPAEDETQFDPKTAPGVMMEQALVNQAQSNVDRARPLVASRAVTAGEYDTMVAMLEAAQARYHSAVNLVGEQISLIGVRRKELALARQMVTDSEIIAPFDGVVGERRVSPGEYVSAGQTVVSLVRADRLRFTAGVPESHASSIRVGQRVQIKRDSAEEPVLETTITRVSPTVMQSSRSILIEADVPNPELKLQAGLFAEADLVVDPDALAIVVPTSAVSRFAGVQKVWLVEDGVAKQQTVSVGREEEGRMEIIAGLEEGCALVLNAGEGHDGPVVAKTVIPRSAEESGLKPSSQ